MKRTHRLLSLLLCLVMALSLLPATAVTAFAAAPTGEAVLSGFAVGREAGSVYISNNAANSLKILAHEDNASYEGYRPEARVGDAAILGAYNPKNAMATSNPDYAYNENSETAIVVDETGRRMAYTDTFQPGMTYRFSFCETGHTLHGAPFADYLGELTTNNFTFRTVFGVTSPTITMVEAKPQQHGSETQGFFYNVYIKMPGDKGSHTVSVTTPVTGGTTATEGTEITLTAPKFHDSKTFTGWQIAVGNKTYTHKADFRDYCGLTDFSSSEGGTEKVTCTFKLGDKNISVKALYSADAIIEFNTVNLNILPVVKNGEPVAMVQPVFGSEGEAYSVGYAFLGKDNKDKPEPGFYTAMKSGEKFDTTRYRYLLTAWLYVNTDHYKFTGNKDEVKFIINGKTYPGASGKIIDHQDDRCPISYDHLSGVNSVSGKYETLRVYIPVGTPNNLQPYYNGGITAVPALDFVDAPRIDSVTVTDAGNTSYATERDNGFTKELEQGINYDIQVKVRVPKAIQDAINSGLMQLQPQFRYLLQGSLTGTNLWQGSQVRTEKDGSDTIYIYSTVGFGPVAGESYMLVFGTNLVTTGSDAQRIAGNIITGTFNCVNTKIADGPTVTGSALKTGDTSGPVLTTSSTQYYIDKANTRAWDIPATGAENGKTYWTMLCLRPNPGYVFDPGYDYTPVVKLGGAAAKTNYAVAVDGSAMFLTVYATAAHEHVMRFVDNGDGTHIYKCTVSGCYSYNGYKEAHIWGEGTVSGDKIIYTCEKCGATTEVRVTVEDKTIYGFKANVTTPKAGDTVGGKTWVTFNETFDTQLSETKVEWKQGETVLNETDVFEVGQEYTITVTFTAAEGYKFYNDTTFEMLRNSDVGPDTHQTYSKDGKTVTQSMSFTVKQSVDVTVAMPDLKAGDTLPALALVPADKLDTTGYCSASVARAGTTTLYEYKYVETANAWKWYKDSVEVENIPLQAGDEVAYWWNFNPTGDNVFNMTVNSEGATNLTTIYSLPTGAILAAYTIPTADDAKAISKVALTVSGYEYGKNVSAAAKGADPANVTTGALRWGTTETAFGAKAYTVTIPVAPAEGYAFASGCLFTVNGYPAAYDAEKGAVTCTLPVLTAPHTHDFGGWTYLNDAVHYHKCDCGTTEMKEHRWEQTGEVEATTTTTGSVTYTCKDCGVEKTETTPKLPETVEPGKPDQPTKPSQPERPNRRPGSGSGAGSTTAKPDKDVKSGNTGDAGIALYAGLALLSVSGGAWIFSRKRKESNR